MAKNGSILLNFLNFSFKKAEAVFSILPNIDEIFKVKTSDLQNINTLSREDVDKIIKFRHSKSFENELRLIEKEDINCLDIFDKQYPLILREIGSPPLVLYTKGQIDSLNEFLFAVVGTRTPTAYGVRMAQEFTHKLSNLGVIIVSGLAKGLDTVAHKEALKNGKTIAVLGSGLLNIYPRENKKLSDNISQNGLLISEFPLFMQPQRENFPRRNRIVSGLSKGVLVVEAAARSGALITARLSCEQNREVFAIPGAIDSPLSKGTHVLIKEGAKLVDSLDDILEELNINIDTSINK